MVCMTTSTPLFGMVQHHVTVLAALLVCSLLLASAQSAPQVDPLKLLDADEAQVQHTELSSNFLQHHHSASPAQPSSPSNNNNNKNNNNNNLSHQNVDPDDLEEPTSSDGSHVKSSSETEPETHVQSSPDKPVTPPFDFQQWKRMYGGEMPADAFTKRFLQGFVGSRGKRAVDEGAVPVNPGLLDQWQAVYDGGDIPEEALSKRFNQAFVGSRGRRGMGEDEEVLPLLYDQRKRATGRQFQSGGTGAAGDSHAVMRRWFNPASFTASRGKRYMPGLEALLLSQMYKKLDAEKWKRQSMLGFHAARG